MYLDGCVHVSYSARLIGCDWSDLVCAAGTVFNQLIVWPVNHRSCDSSGHAHAPVLHRLQQHKVAVVWCSSK